MTDDFESAVDPDYSPWTDLLADAEAIAAEYRDDDWTVDVVAPQDVAPWTGSAADAAAGGFVVLVDDESFDELRPVVADRPFGAAEIYQRSVADAILLILVELDAPTERAIVLPLYYRSGEADDALSGATDAGELQVRIRPDGGDDWLTFVHDDPTLFESAE